MTRSVFALCAFVLALAAVACEASEEAASEPVEFGVRYELKSENTGRTYRIYLYVPSAAAPAQGYPVVYLLDGDLHFGVAASINRLRAWSNDMPHAVIVGIGYASNDFQDVVRARWSDLTLPAPLETLNSGAQALKPELGGLDKFLSFVVDEVKPFAEARAPIDKSCQAFVGHSMGGLAVVRALFRRSEAFQAYAALSPSIWWNKKAVLEDEEAFTARLAKGEIKARVLFTAGGLEEDPSDWLERNPEIAERIVDNRQIRNATELAARLQAHQSQSFKVASHVFDGDTHISVIPAALNRGLAFVLDCQ